MKSLLFIFLFFSFKLVSQNNVFYINGYRFSVKEEIVNSSYPSKLDRVIYFYRDGNYLLKHYIKRHFADENNDYISYGSYSVNGNIITFNTSYSQTGEDPIPEERIQKFSVNSSGKLILVSDKEYYPDNGWINSTFKE